MRCIYFYAGGIEIQKGHQLKEGKSNNSMPSGPYIFFIARTIPDILRKYFVSSFSLSEEMADFYLSIMTCPNCTSLLDGYWRHQINSLVTRALDIMFRSNDVEEIVTFDTKIPCEYFLDRWVHQTRGEFRELAEKRCPVIDLLLRDRIIEEKNLPAYQRSLKSLQEPTTGMILQL